MRNVLLCSAPLTGHVQPMINIGKQLVDDGSTVVMLTGNRFREKVRRAGLEHIALPVSSDFDDRDLDGEFPGRSRLPGILRSRYDLENLFVENIADQHRAVSKILSERAIDVVLAENLFLGLLPTLAARDGHTPRIGTVCTSPLMASSRDTAPFGPGLPPSSTRWGMRRNQLLSAAARALVLRRVQRKADAAVQEAVGRDAGTFILDWPLLADDIFVLTAPSFEYPRRDLDDRLDYVGPVLDTAGTTAPAPAWWHRLDGADPVVVVTQGTLDNGDMGRLIEPTLSALAHTRTLVIATTGGPAAETVRAPGANSIVAEFVPFDTLLPRADVLVTNGGWGGVHFALRHGVPIVVAGSTEDKNEVAARIVRSGAGIRLRSTRPTAIRRAVRTVLDDPGYRERARALAKELSGLDGARGISKALNAPPKNAGPTRIPPEYIQPEHTEPEHTHTEQNPPEPTAGTTVSCPPR